MVPTFITDACLSGRILDYIVVRATEYDISSQLYIKVNCEVIDTAKLAQRFSFRRWIILEEQFLHFASVYMVFIVDIKFRCQQCRPI